MLLGFSAVTALLLVLIYVDQHYRGIVARKDREIHLLNEELTLLRALALAIEMEEFESETEGADDQAAPYTIRYPLVDRPWPVKDGVDQ